MKQELTIFGASLHQGKLDSGQEYDFAKLFCLADMDDTKGTRVGSNMIEVRAVSRLFENVKKITSFPAKVLATFELQATGQGGSKTVVTSLDPVGAKV